MLIDKPRLIKRCFINDVLFRPARRLSIGEISVTDYELASIPSVNPITK